MVRGRKRKPVEVVNLLDSSDDEKDCTPSLRNAPLSTSSVKGSITNQSFKIQARIGSFVSTPYGPGMVIGWKKAMVGKSGEKIIDVTTVERDNDGENEASSSSCVSSSSNPVSFSTSLTKRQVSILQTQQEQQRWQQAREQEQKKQQKDKDSQCEHKDENKSKVESKDNKKSDKDNDDDALNSNGHVDVNVNVTRNIQCNSNSNNNDSKRRKSNRVEDKVKSTSRIFEIQLPFGVLYMEERQIRPFHDYTISIPGLQMCYSDLIRLQPKMFLNDNIVNFALDNINRSLQSHTMCMNTYFLESIRAIAYSKSNDDEKSKRYKKLARRMRIYTDDDIFDCSNDNINRNHNHGVDIDHIGDSSSSSNSNSNSSSSISQVHHLLVPFNCDKHWSLIMVRNIVTLGRMLRIQERERERDIDLQQQIEENKYNRTEMICETEMTAEAEAEAEAGIGTDINIEIQEVNDTRHGNLKQIEVRKVKEVASNINTENYDKNKDIGKNNKTKKTKEKGEKDVPLIVDANSPALVLIDSATAHRAQTAFHPLREFLRFLLDKKGDNLSSSSRKLSASEIPGLTLKEIPQQDNSFDCGLYVIEFARKLMESPPNIDDMGTHIVRGSLQDLKNMTQCSVLKPYFPSTYFQDIPGKVKHAREDYLKQINLRKAQTMTL